MERGASGRRTSPPGTVPERGLNVVRGVEAEPTNAYALVSGSSPVPESAPASGRGDSEPARAPKGRPEGRAGGEDTNDTTGRQTGTGRHSGHRAHRRDLHGYPQIGPEALSPSTTAASSCPRQEAD